MSEETIPYRVKSAPVSDTPETDAFGNRPREWPEFARRLERERDRVSEESERRLDILRRIMKEVRVHVRSFPALLEAAEAELYPSRSESERHSEGEVKAK